MRQLKSIVLASALLTGFVASMSVSEACALPELAARSISANAGDPAFLPRVSEDERTLARIDREITESEKQWLSDCLEARFRGLTAGLPAPLNGIAAWRTDEATYYFPGNDYSYGSLFANPLGAGYFEAQPIPPGGILAKRAFKISAKGEASIHELAIMVRRAGIDGPSRWDWIKVTPDGALTRPTAECLVCHQGKAEQDFLFGLSFIRQKPR